MDAGSVLPVQVLGSPLRAPACSSCSLAACHRFPWGRSRTPVSRQAMPTESQLNAGLLAASSSFPIWNRSGDAFAGACCHVLP